MSILKFNEDIANCKLKFDSGQKVEGEYGVQYKWSCNADDVFFATEQFNALIMAHDVNVGDVLSIRKVKKEKIDGTFFMVFEVNGKTLDDFNAMPKPTTQEPIYETPTSLNPPTEPTSDRVAELEKRVAALEDKVGTPSVTKEDIPF